MLGKLCTLAMVVSCGCGTLNASTFQISLQYSLMVLSEEKNPI